MYLTISLGISVFNRWTKPDHELKRKREREREREKTVKRDDFSQQVEMLMGWSRGALWSLSVLRN